VAQRNFVKGKNLIPSLIVEQVAQRNFVPLHF